MSAPTCERTVGTGAPLVALVTVVLLTFCTSCGDDDPLAARLQVRASHEVNVESFNSRDDDTILVELAVRSPRGPVLDTLTVTIRQHDLDQEVLQEDRVPLDLSAMDATGVLRVFTSVQSAGGAVEAISVVVEMAPAEADYKQFPEIQTVLP